MEREAVRQSQSEHREPSNGSQTSAPDSAPSSSSTPTAVTPTPPRLTPNPLLLDCPAPLPPTTCSPPPPLTPAPSLSASHVTKTTTPTSPYLLVPAPPKLTSTATPTLRTYARPILPSPAKTSTSTTTTSPAPITTASTTTAASSLATKTSTTLTNGSSRMVSTTTSTPITPFHTPASPPGRQVSQSLPVGTPGLARANQSAAPVRQRVSQQTLLLGKGLKGSGQDQVLLRAQMLQSLTLRPPPPGALTIPPSLRLKPPSSAPPPLSRPQTPLFPPLRPRPVTTTTAESTTTTPSRHLSIPPPTLYSPVRAVPLRPRLLSPNGHRSPTPRQPLHSIAAAAAPTTGPSSTNRPITGLKTCPLSPTILSPGQHPPPPPDSLFERSPSAARQLQIIALSSGRQLQTNVSSQNKDSETVLPLSPTLAKTSSPLPSPTLHKPDVVKEKLKQEGHEEGTKATKVIKVVDQREKVKSKIEKEDVIETKKARLDEKVSSEAEAQSGKNVHEEKKRAAAEMDLTDQSKSGKNREDVKDSNIETRRRISAPVFLPSPVKPSPPCVQNPESIQAAIPLTVPVRAQNTTPPSLSSGLSTVPAATAGKNSSPVPTVMVPVASPVSVPSNQSHQRFTEIHSTNQKQQRVTEIQSTNQSQQRATEIHSTNQKQQRATEIHSTNQKQQRVTEIQSTNQSQQRATEIQSTNQRQQRATEIHSTNQKQQRVTEIQSTNQSQQRATEIQLTNQSQQRVTGIQSTNQSQQRVTEIQSTNQSQQRIIEIQSTNQSQQRVTEIQSTNQSQQRATEIQLTNQSQQRVTEIQPTNQSQQRVTEIQSTNQKQQRITESQSTNQSQQRIIELKSTNQSQQSVTEPTNQSQQRIRDLQSTNQSHQRISEATNQDDNMSIQSDNQSALSSLSSQSPPSSPFVSPSTDPPQPPPQPDRPTDLSLNHKQDQNSSPPNNHELHTEPKHLNQSEDEEMESFDQSEICPWEPRAWPEGQQVLTHLVEGFVIQEGLTPFPVHRSSLLVPEQVTKTQEVNGTNESAVLPVTVETRKPAEQHSTDSEEEEEGGDTDDHNNRLSQRDRAVLHCQFCGKRGHAHNFMRSKRFCSTSCARGFNVRLTKRLRALSAGSRSEPRPRPALNRAESVPGKPLLIRLPKDLWSAGRREKDVKDKPPTSATAEDEDMELEAGAEEDDDEDDDDGPEEEEDEEDEEEEEPAAAMATTTNDSMVQQQHRARRASAPAVTSTFRPAPSQWSVEEVTAFINTLPGCGDVAEAFRVQEIDGQALLLLTEDHLMTSMNIKLGPALKICAHINTLKNQ